MTPWVVDEAAAAGLPVIAADVGAVPELVLDGDTGFLLRRHSAEDDFVRAVETLLADRPMGEAMSERAQSRAALMYNRRSVLSSLFDRLLQVARTDAAPASARLEL